jgi:hypothetical protein
MLGVASLGAVIAAIYGVIHDQITYSLSPEYFTRFKFRQFHYADFGLPERIFVGEIGALATWWVGFIAGWFIARIVVACRPDESLLPHARRAYLIMIGSTLLAGVLGYAYGTVSDISPQVSAIAKRADEDFGVTDTSAFTRVAYIHNAGYLGALVGLISSVLSVRFHPRMRPV